MGSLWGTRRVSAAPTLRFVVVRIQLASGRDTKYKVSGGLGPKPQRAKRIRHGRCCDDRHRHFVFIHVSRTAAPFSQSDPGGVSGRAHDSVPRAPRKPSARPLAPARHRIRSQSWDWYVSMHQDYRRKRQYVYQVLSEQGALDFERTVARFLNLGDGSGESRALLRRLAAAAPKTTAARGPGAGGGPDSCRRTSPAIPTAPATTAGCST